MYFHPFDFISNDRYWEKSDVYQTSDYEDWHTARDLAVDSYRIFRSDFSDLIDDGFLVVELFEDGRTAYFVNSHLTPYGRDGLALVRQGVAWDSRSGIDVDGTERYFNGCLQRSLSDLDFARANCLPEQFNYIKSKFLSERLKRARSETGFWI